MVEYFDVVTSVTSKKSVNTFIKPAGHLIWAYASRQVSINRKQKQRLKPNDYWCHLATKSME